MVLSLLDREIWRVRFVLIGMLVALGFLGVMLWRIQVAQSYEYEKDQIRQSVRRVRLPGIRGKIYDRNGLVLADNRPGYSVAIYLEEVRKPGPWSRTIDHIEGIIGELAEELQIEPALTRDQIQAHIRRRLPLPLMAWRDVDNATLARWAERASARPGVDVYTEAIRVYPQGAMASHLIGYVGRADFVQDEAEPYHYYIPEMEGRTGLERVLDADLRGDAGGQLVLVDVAGYRYDDLGMREPGIGRDILLTLDARIQRLAEDALDDEPGAVVVIDPNNGDVLALASTPGFDPNEFIPAISTERWNLLRDDTRNPLVNRAIAGAYAPGSIFKPIVAIAALENERATPDTQFDCPGYFELGRTRFHCWSRQGHGRIHMRQSLEQSCNVYYFKLSLQIGYEVMYHMAAALGLGRRTGLELEHETPGVLPNDAWKRRFMNDAWRDGDTVNVSIGQGPITVSPLQMAVVAAAIGNGGYVHTPRVIAGYRDAGAERFEPVAVYPPKNMNWSPQTREVIRGGMRDVVMSPRGTGRLAQVPHLEFAGKTGTAEFGPKEAGKKHAWMIAFAPYDRPQVAVALFVEEGVSGGSTAAPRVKTLMQGIFEQDIRGGGAG